MNANENAYYKELVRRFQEENDKEAEKKLLEHFYSQACKYARKHIYCNTYSNLITYEVEEINSYVYIAFLKTIKTYKHDGDHILSFKNYLYQMIKYETLIEIKKTFSLNVIPNYQKQCKLIQKDIFEDNEETKKLEKLQNQMQINAIFKFLDSKQTLYGTIWQLKSEGFDNRDICKKLNLSEQEMKSKFQYIKRLILAKYSKKSSVK